MTTTMMKTPRVGLYARVSTHNGQDVGLQLDELRAVAQQRGWAVVGEFVDEGLSGSKDSRPALDTMMREARSGKIDLVAVWRFDRFARSTRHLIDALEDFRILGVQFVSLREAVDTSTATGKMVFTFLAAIAEFERALIVERVRAGVARAQASGKHCGRPRHEFDIRPVLALQEQGHSLSQIAKMLGKPKTTIRRRLKEAQEGTLDGCAKSPPARCPESPVPQV